MSGAYGKQVRIEPGGLWHRIRAGNGDSHTACGKEIPPAVQWTREYKLDALICYDCFTRHEIATGQHRALVKEDAKYPDDLPLSKRPSTEDRRAERRRAARDTDVDSLHDDTLRDLPSSDTVLADTVVGEPDEPGDDT